MRSSIACARCRRSKIKCVNAGIDTTCRACEASGRECIYPTPAIGINGSAVKRDIQAVADGEDRNGEWDSPKRQRSRKSLGLAGASAKDAAKAAAEALDASILTIKVWESVFDLFQSHFSTMLPFLHPATFLSQIRQLATASQSLDGAAAAAAASSRGQSQSPVPKVEPSPLILLGVLALTARFHPQLVSYHSPPSPGNPSNPLAASEFYAAALRSRLAGVDGANLAVPELTRVQALLMLALHEWGICRGKSAWLYVGMAIRLSQAIGLPFDLENEVYTREPQRSPAALKPEAEHFGLLARRVEPKEQSSDDVIAQETKRRTFWACFMLDRCLSSGKYRPRMIRVKELNIQLPSDNAFAFGERVRTSRLNEQTGRRPQSLGSQGMQIPSIRQSIGGFGDDKLSSNGGASDSKSWSPASRRKSSGDEDIDRWEVGAEEPVLSRVIRIIRVWGSIAKWSCAGGRRTEQFPPWHSESRFLKLRGMLAEFQDGLSRNLRYSPRNTDTHIMYKNTLASYTVMHVLYFLSVIVLHRAYVPFLPVRCNEPVGPLDDPVFPSEKTPVPDGFWRESARELFRAARQMLDLVVTCQERGVLVENPLVGFAIYHAAFVGIYAAHFPHMDQDGQLCHRPAAGDGSGTVGPAQARKALSILREMRPRLKMAAGWFRTLNRLHTYFSKVKKEFRRFSRRDTLSDGGGYDPLSSNGVRPIREGGSGGGLEEFKLLEKLFLDFGSIEDQLPDATAGLNDDDGSGGGGPADRLNSISDAGSKSVKSDLAADGIDYHSDNASNSHRRESWVPVNSPGMPMPPGPGPDTDRRPSLPMLASRPSFSLPSIQHHTPPDGPPHFHTSSPNLPSITSSGAYAPLSSTSQQPSSSSQYLSAGSNPNRLQPLNSWLNNPRSQPPAPPPPYSQSLPPINAATQPHHHQLHMLPRPGSVSYNQAPSPPAFSDSVDPTSWSTSLGGDDVLAFLDGGASEHWPPVVSAPSELGVPAGWLSLVWSEFSR